MQTLVIKIMVLTMILHMIDTLAYSIRLNSVKNGQFALSTSLFNTVSLITRISSTFLLPSIGLFIGQKIKQHVDPLWDIRAITFSATIGAILGSACIPTFLRVFGKAVDRLEVVGTIPGLLVHALSIANIKRMTQNATLPRKRLIHGLRYREIPKRLLVMNIVVTGVYTIGVLASNYASTMVQTEDRIAVANSSGFINGIATILLALLIDPKSAVITDQAMRGKLPYGDVKALVTLLILTKIIGTLFGQLILVPSAEFIALFYR